MQSANTQPTTQENAKKTNGNLIKVLIILLPVIFYFIFNSGGSSEKDAIEAAEKWVNKQVYSSLGVLPQEFRSVEIYKEGKKRLIEVKFGLKDKNWDGTYCVYTEREYVLGGTNMMGADYSFKSHLAETKAIFGL